MALAGLRSALVIAAIAALGVASLGAAFILRDSGGAATVGGSDIGEATFEPSPEDAPKARNGRIVVVTLRQGSYAEVDAVMTRAIERYCPDGRGYSVSRLAPSDELSLDDWDKPRYPAGSNFSQDIRCDGPLPNEMALAADATDQRAEATVLRRLAELGVAADVELNVMTVPYYEAMPKYHAYDRALGARIRGYSSDWCRDGQVVVNAIVVGNHPDTPRTQGRPAGYSRMAVGTALSCLRPADNAN